MVPVQAPAVFQFVASLADRRLQNGRGNMGALNQVVVQLDNIRLGNGAHGALGVVRQAQFSNQHYVQRCVQGLRNHGRHRYASARQAQYDHVRGSL